MANTKMGLLARKLGMTQIFEDDGAVIAATVLEVGPCTVLQKKTAGGPDGYDAVQLGYATRKHGNKAQKGHLAKSGVEKVPEAIREVRLTPDTNTYEVGQQVTLADVFEEGTKVDVTGSSKGKGTAGVMKRWNFKGFIRSHGTHEFFRHGGSIGTRLTPGHVLKGKKMGGHMGSVKTTVQNLVCAKLDTERGLMFVKGGVPGPNGGIVLVRVAVKG